MSIADRVPSVNYHLWKACNMRCGFCFATFQDIHQGVLPKGHLGREDSMSVVDSLARAGFRKVSFAGGEPTLCPWLRDLIRLAKELGLTTSVVTNGSNITREWVEGVAGNLDWAALSVDAVDPVTLLEIGRATASGPMGCQDYLKIADIIKQHDIRLKINTVVSRHNLMDDLTQFIIEVRPERWKLLQVLPVEGQNDDGVLDSVVSNDEFNSYVQRSGRVKAYGIEVVPECNDRMTGSYVMVDPAGRFFDNVAGNHTYSRPMLDVGVDVALEEISIDSDKFLSRGGLYDW